MKANILADIENLLDEFFDTASEASSSVQSRVMKSTRLRFLRNW